jgi:hypothetical protein
VEPGFASDRAHNRAHDLIAKPPTLWRIMRSPFAGLLGSSLPIKFEEQFKYRDEHSVNAQAAQGAADLQKCLFHGANQPIVGFGLP